MSAENATKADATATKPRPRKIGVVKSDKMQKTITVVVERLVKHPLYKKYVRERTVLKAHDEKNEAKAGSVVEVEFSRPLSKTKRWNLVRVIRAAEGGLP
jgi:small subunit ribosomal protein S17